MSDSEIPEPIRKKHPELAAVGEALAQWRRGEPITARCITCGRILEVTEVQATGTTVVLCPEGHTSYRSKHS